VAAHTVQLEDHWVPTAADRTAVLVVLTAVQAIHTVRMVLPAFHVERPVVQPNKRHRTVLMVDLTVLPELHTVQRELLTDRDLMVLLALDRTVLLVQRPMVQQAQPVPQVHESRRFALSE